MVLTDRQRSDLHAGIYEYFLSRPGEWFAAAAEALEKADPEACEQKKKNNIKGGASSSSSSSPFKPTSSSSAPVLEKKWTAVPRLQKKVLELERALSSVSALGINTTANGTTSEEGGSSATTAGGTDRRNIPRPPATLTLSGHTNVVTSVSLHPSYSLVASGSDDGSIKLWDIESGDLLKTLRGHINTVTHVSFDDSIPFTSSSSRGGGTNTIVCRMLASCSTDLSIKLWTLKEGSTISDWVCTKTMRGHDHTVSCIAFVPNTAGYNNKNSRSSSSSSSSTVTSNYLISASRDTSIRVWEVSTGACIQIFTESTDWVRCLALTSVIPLTYLSSGSQGVVMASGCNDSSITLWTLIEENITSGDGTTTGSRGLINNNDMSNVRSNNNKKSNSSFAVLRGHDHVVECVAFVRPSSHSSVGSTSSSSNAISKISQQLSKGTSKVESDGTSTTGGTTSSFLNKAGYNIHNLLVSGSRDKAVKIWNITTQECLMTFNVHENWVRSVILHPSGNFIISAGDDRSIRVLDLKSRRCLRSITEAHTHFVTSLAMHRSLPILVSGGVDQVINCWALD